MIDAAVLRVLSGRLTGTEKRLPPSGRVSVGHEFWQDVVIRDPATKGIAVELERDGDGAQLTVLSGSVTLLGSPVGAGTTALLPPYVPFAIGGVAVAWGAPDAARWDEAAQLAGAQPAPPELPAPVTDQALAALGGAGARLARWAHDRRAATLAGVAVVVLLLALVMPTAVAGLGLFGTPVARAERVLAQAGFARLAVSERGAGDGVLVQGFVAGGAARDRVAQTLAANDIPAELRLRTTADLAAASADVARLQDIRAAARPLGERVVELRTAPIGEAQRERLVAAIRSDVPGIRRLKLRGDLPAAEEVVLRQVSDATKKVSTVVSGDPSYIQTVDGARYFGGALLPSGHRLVAIQGNLVVLDKGGRQSRVAF
jgi:type III secretion protein D